MKYSSFELIFKGSRDGFRADTFHEMCDNKGPTLSVMQTEDGMIIGGFTTTSWNPTNEYLPDKNAFLFSLTKEKVFKLKESQQPYAI
mmetsp:Transcript_32800/g.32025  ORF Transcript_32800/g.32025 Transcript_32800/m.32025 type:complete len:87 (-) Transcript_32800:50-310(-)|eukprot:CAMPEP_0170567174 /NCGR_PEP_ID=MMETSP0211-20121228/80314_1 /TAXON_ID=311385 /ORGANISM="Pseudokeronopsis sp., Strain OXSARD2" /LENGTH=86 /DNA_ID=CAMNT_0010888561 /DNA_START=710 /DNA_END=970 /DNA_ORIENTATION=+